MTAHTHAETMAELARQEKVLAELTHATPWLPSGEAIGYWLGEHTCGVGGDDGHEPLCGFDYLTSIEGNPEVAALIVQAREADRLAVARGLLTEHDDWLTGRNGALCAKCGLPADECKPRLMGARLVWGQR